MPLKEWFSGELKDFVQDIFRSRRRAGSGRIFNADAVLANFDSAGRFSRKIWGLLSLELWHQMFHDRGGRISVGMIGDCRNRPARCSARIDDA